MTNTMKTLMRGGATIAAAAAAMLSMSGCTTALTTASSGPISVQGPVLRGAVHGGRAPISGAAIQLYAASTSGYAGATTNLLPVGVAGVSVTNADGTFNITSQYTCTAGQQMYLVSVGGDTGGNGVSNPQAVLMAGMGDCLTLKSTGFINMNEVTTVATTFALAPFMTGYTNMGSSATNTAGLARAMVSVNKLANVNSGYAGGPALQATATAPLAEIYTVADILAACVNTPSGGTQTGTICGNLFAAATPSGVTPPTDTVGLALMMAHYPTQNVGGTFNYVSGTVPYQPTLNQQPTDWTMSIKYAPAGLSAPTSTTIDGNGSVWVANSTGNSVTVLAQNGQVSNTLTGNGLTNPVTVAIDASGNGWVANKGSNTVSAFTAAGGVVGASPFTVGTAPVALAFDGAGNVFVANSASNSISELNSSGTLVNTLTTGVNAPSALALNPR